MSTKREVNDRSVYDRGHVFEVHDSAIQALYGIGLKLEYCTDLIDEAPDQAKRGIDACIHDLGELIDRIRVFIHDE